MSSNPRLAVPIVALSVISDLAKGFDEGQAMRTAVVTVRLAKRMRVDGATCSAGYWAALLRFVGCTATASEVAEDLHDEIAVSAAFSQVDPRNLREVLNTATALYGRRPDRIARFLLKAPSVIRRHEIASCEVGRLLASQLELPRSVSDSIGSIFERFDGKGNPGVRAGKAIPLPARIEQVAHLAERAWSMDADVDAALRRRSGGILDPEIVEAFCVDSAELFVDLPEVDAPMVLDAEPSPQVRIPAGGLNNVARAIGAVVDVKSPFLVGHSNRVSELAAAAAERAMLSAGEIDVIRQAGWLQDVGRVGVSSRIWNKPGRLTAVEWEQVRMHSYFGRRVLESVPGWEPVAKVAAQHHERLDGSGYPGAERGRISLSSSILAAADVYCALGEARPHRDALDADARSQILDDEVAHGRLDHDAVAAVLASIRRGGVQRPSLAGRVVSPVSEAMVASSPGPTLTGREKEVLALVAKGLTNRAIARRLAVSPKTVNAHLEHVFSKLGVSNRAAAVFQAAACGIVPSAIG